MSIMEKNLPVAESIGEGDMVRVVTSGGNSKNVDASKIGGSEYFKITVTRTNDGLTADKTFQEIKSAIQSGKIAYVEYDPSGAGYQLKHFMFDVLNTTYDEVSSDVNFHCVWLERLGKLYVEMIKVTYQDTVVNWSSPFNHD